MVGGCPCARVALSEVTVWPSAKAVQSAVGAGKVSKRSERRGRPGNNPYKREVAAIGQGPGYK